MGHGLVLSFAGPEAQFGGCSQKLRGLSHETGGHWDASVSPKVGEWDACRGRLLCSHASLGRLFTFPGEGFRVSTSEANALDGVTHGRHRGPRLFCEPGRRVGRVDLAAAWRNSLPRAQLKQILPLWLISSKYSQMTLFPVAQFAVNDWLMSWFYLITAASLISVEAQFSSCFELGWCLSYCDLSR